MKVSELTPRENSFLRKVHDAEEHNPSAYIGILALLCSMAGGDIPEIPAQYSRAALKRAIRYARELQKDHPDFNAAIEDSIAFIRCKWLHKERT